MFDLVRERMKDVLTSNRALVHRMRHGMHVIVEMETRFTNEFNALRTLHDEQPIVQKTTRIIDILQQGEGQVIKTAADVEVHEVREDNTLTYAHFRVLHELKELSGKHVELRALVTQCEQTLHAVYNDMLEELTKQYDAAEELGTEEEASTVNRQPGVAIIMNAMRDAWHLTGEGDAISHDLKEIHTSGDRIVDAFEKQAKGVRATLEQLHSEEVSLEHAFTNLLGHVKTLFSYYTVIIRVLIGQFFIFKADEKMLQHYLASLNPENGFSEGSAQLLHNRLEGMHGSVHEQGHHLLQMIVSERHHIG
ncbi:MAG: hypothetical protein OXR66_02055 [Candidatus Woesearchaeota archaeon]|nr:hypothetical protein [Candidatus Woesearchaeota archaeon]